ncbi:hypothetical protein PC128_g27556 [Phytophthora cactorum]|nr:hypothetical protein C6341_g27724 [Phytophthora cactorum]KAG3123961.1 hypothetical protein PC128_g27556 [Phytophthora cactorum]
MQSSSTTDILYVYSRGLCRIRMQLFEKNTANSLVTAYGRQVEWSLLVFIFC